MKRLVLIVAVIVGLAVLAAGGVTQGAPPANWLTPMTPFRVADNLYYVGSKGLSAWLITTPGGHIVIDAPLDGNLDRMKLNIETLGFKVSDVKILLNSHAHFDHTGGLARLKRDTGAIMAASEGDRPALEQGVYPGSEDQDFLKFEPVKVDRVLKDGDVVSLGGVSLTAHVTPGHSPGCTTWTLPLKVDGQVRQAMIYCSTTVAANRLAPDPQYPGIVADYRRTFARLATMKADIFLAPHPEQFDMAAKLARLNKGGPNPFVDPGELPVRVAQSRKAFEAALAKQQKKAAS
ncbi:MAG: subclass B3 metallo-beta-lactamase [Caulobacter sp.]|nr:subclass B3 metallo-beta-lactamase [Caulobacter sp.]